MFDWLGDQFEFLVVTRDRDLGDSQPYSDRQTGRWYPIQGGQVRYVSAMSQVPTLIRTVMDECEPQLLYLNSAVDPMLAICPLVLRRLRYLRDLPPVVVAPRGEFSPGALAIKRAKKATYLHAARLLGLYDDVIWHATSPTESVDIREWWGEKADVLLAENMPPRDTLSVPVRRNPKQVGQLRLVFLSRIARKKNLLGALRILKDVKGSVIFDIYGSLEDSSYFAECEEAMADLPANISATYKGSVSPDSVIATLSSYDAFFLPTLGENFGHAILEALLAGCPVILSDQTPWRELAERSAGFDCSLDSPAKLKNAVEAFIPMNAEEFSAWSAGARRCGVDYCSKSDLVTATRTLFQQALVGTGGAR
jgi:glycosyltransferase involved in cell wall biosynthesis